MLSKTFTRTIICWALSMLYAVIPARNLHAYSRDKAVEYAREWSENTGEMTGIHNPYYRLEELDCAGFVSQCVIAGGIRFYAKYGNGINATLIDPYNANETETSGVGGAPIITRRMASIPPSPRDYSRTVPTATHLPFSLFHKKHGGRRYEPPYNNDKWNDLEPGDTVYEHIDGSYYHCMLVSEVTSSQESLKYCGHSSWRVDADDELISEDIGSDWKTGNSRLICLPDAPCVKYFTIVSGGHPIKWRWVTKLCVEDYREFASKADLVFRVTFDTNMKTQEVPSIRLRVGTTDYSFEPYTGSDYTNGWWTSATSGDYIRYCTWKGQILADDLPAVKNAMGKILIHAKADDGSYNDRTNNLGRYVSYTSMDCIRIKLDTKTCRSNNPRSER